MITNNNNISLPLQIYLAHSDYDLIKGDDYISATSLLKPIKSTILARRIKGSTMDVMDMVPSAVGTASHDRLEKSFLHGNHVVNLKKLGYSKEVISKIRINPIKEEPGTIPIYLERRSIKPIGKWRVGGKFDFVSEGVVRDLKTTKVFSWMKGDFNDYIIQGSIYRWLNPDIITEDHMYIDFLFTDWKKFELESKKGYPPTPACSKAMELMPISTTESWIECRLNLLEKFWDSEQGDIPNCNQKELWQDEPKFAYFKNPTGKRATKVFESLTEATIRLHSDGNVGKIDTRLGTPKRCNYCSAKSICYQAQGYIAKGVLEA